MRMYYDIISNNSYYYEMTMIMAGISNINGVPNETMIMMAWRIMTGKWR